MQSVLDIATRVSTPLMLAGFLAAAFFLTLRQIIAKNIFPRLAQQLGGKILLVIINRLFVLALVAMILGFGGYILGTLYPSRTVAQSTVAIDMAAWIAKPDIARTTGRIQDQLNEL